MSRSSTREREAVESQDGSEPSSPTDISGQGWVYVARKTMREFSKDQCTDLAAALTYYAVLALFPAMLAILSLVGVFGQGPRTVDAIKQILTQTGAPAGGTLSKALTSISKTPAPGIAPDHRPGDRAVVRLWLRRRVRPRHEPDLRGR